MSVSATFVTVNCSVVVPPPVVIWPLVELTVSQFGMVVISTVKYTGFAEVRLTDPESEAPLPRVYGVNASGVDDEP